MLITFKRVVPIPDTMTFERVYEDGLQTDEEEKTRFAACPSWIASWLFVNGTLAGETYGLSLKDLREVEPGIEAADDPSDGAFRRDIAALPDSTLYRYSTTILPAFQGQGLGRILVAHWMGQALAKGYAQVVGHATAPAMEAIHRTFGARFDERVTMGWFETQRTARFYRVLL
jgi:GNAT superfamily N-acetyltransferase